MSDSGQSRRPITQRKKRAQETRKRIFDSALELFQERGYDNVSVDDIAARAGTAKGSFYTYFGTKSDIIIEEFRSLDEYAQEILGSLPAESTASERLSVFVSRLLDYYYARVGHQTLGILYINQLSSSESMRIVGAPGRPTVDAIEVLIEEGQRGGEFVRETDPTTLAGWVNRAMRGLYVDWAVSRGAFHLPKEGMRYFSAVILPALRVKHSSS
jgi:AcrR family transcriptional regulator